MASAGDRDPSEAATRPLRPQAIVPLVAVVAAQSIVLFAAAVWLLSGLFTGHAASVGATVMLAALLAGGGLWLLRAAMGLWAGRRWPRAAALTAQLFAVIIAGAVILPFSGWLALAVILAALVAGASLFRQSVVDWTTQDVPEDRR
ncbi:hypothetical protein [Kocuria palustris]|uniref:hypothetical protein n=1 Tax=Kocuria palustris TaxID=71999 RepID=UPI0011A8FAF6|nr:hypothetical protein [Kocuria palustris]